MNVQKWKIINKDYLDYLRENYESRIPRTDYGNDKLKPFFGELMRVGDLAYVTQVSSAKPRHNKIKANIDFQKIIHNDVLIAVVNLNYMFPYDKPEHVISKRCFDFKTLENGAHNWTEKLIK